MGEIYCKTQKYLIQKLVTLDFDLDRKRVDRYNAANSTFKRKLYSYVRDAINRRGEGKKLVRK